MAWTEDDYNRLCSAIGTGAQMVMYADKQVQYRTLSEMQQLKTQMEKELGIGKKKSRKYLPCYSKGLK